MSCSCGGRPTLLFPCSGAADVGELADQSARAAARRGHGRMSCLAGVGARVGTIMDGARAAGRIIAIDGCPECCASGCIEAAGIKADSVIRLHDLGFSKGSSPCNDANRAVVLDEIRVAVAAPEAGATA